MMRNLGMRSMLAATVAICAVATASPAFAQAKSFNVPAQAAISGIPELARQADVQILVSEGAVRGKTTRAVKGSMSVEQALRQLLKGTGLRISSNDGRTFTLVSGAAAAPSSQVSDTSGQANEGNEDIVVTGSYIAHRIEDSASPVDVYTRKQLNNFGINTAGDLLAYIPGNQGTSQTNPYTTVGGNRFPSLRGLGTGSTLVLIDGRRPAASAASMSNPATPAQFNLDMIPEGAIERVEILKDSASATYGSDAIGGVINLILRKKYQGIDVSGRYEHVTDGGTAMRTISAVGGTSSGGFSIIGGFTYYKQDQLIGKDRDFIASLDKTPFGGTNFFAASRSAPLLANVRSVDGSNLPGLNSSKAATPSVDPRTLTIADFQATQGQSNPLVDYYGLRSILQPEERYSGFLHATQEINDNITASLDFFGSTQTALYFSNTPYTATLGANNPYNPFKQNVIVNFYLLNPPRSTADTRSTDLSVSGGLKGKIAGDWTFDVNGGYGWSRFRDSEVTTNFNGEVTAALLSSDPNTALNPFFGGAGNSASLLASLRDPSLSAITKTTNATATAVASGTLGDIGGGPIKLAIGVDYRYESLFQNQRNYTETAPRIVDVGRSVVAGFAELSLPLIANARTDQPIVEVVAAGRGEHYSDFGGTFNTKAGLVIRPTRALTLRGIYSTAFQAPSLSQLNAPLVPTSGSFFVITDPKNGQSYSPSGFIFTGGNPNLKPQDSDSILIGGDYQFSVGKLNVKFSAAGYHIKLKNQIQSSISNQDLLTLENTYPGIIERDPATGLVVNIYSLPENLSRVTTQGVDLGLTMDLAVGSGHISSTTSATIVDKYDVLYSPFSTSITDRRGYIGYSNPFKLVSQLGYSNDKISVATVINYAASYDSDVPPQVKISSNFTVNALASYYVIGREGTRGRHLKAEFGVTNLFNRRPPFYNSPYGFDYGEGDPLGRRVYFRLSGGF